MNCLEQNPSEGEEVGRRDAAARPQDEENHALRQDLPVVLQIVVSDAPREKASEQGPWVLRQFLPSKLLFRPINGCGEGVYLFGVYRSVHGIL